jgi:N-acetylglucosamine-6-sulfatase
MLGVLLVSAACTDKHSDSEARPDGRPNIVVIMTDDQTVASMRVMTEVHELLARQGVTFEQNIVSYPLCCPSRATYLTGQYAKNNGVHGNTPPNGGYSAFTHQDTTFVAALRTAGYDTIHIGKYLNGYGPDPIVPPGWSKWYGAIDPTTYQYYGYTLFQNGKSRTYGTRARDYQTDVFTALAVSTIHDEAKKDTPFFLNVAYLAPHVQSRSEGSDGNPSEGERSASHAIPAPEHSGDFAREPLPQPSSFDESDVTDKPAVVQQLPRISPATRRDITESYRDALESLLSVDEGVKRIVDALEATGELDRTVILYTSDNGFLNGEHRIPRGKSYFYEPSIRVPLVVRAPSAAHGVVWGPLFATRSSRTSIWRRRSSTSPMCSRCAHPTAVRSHACSRRRSQPRIVRSCWSPGLPPSRTTACELLATRISSPRRANGSSTTSEPTLTSSTTSLVIRRARPSKQTCRRASSVSSSALVRPAIEAPRVDGYGVTLSRTSRSGRRRRE